MLPQDSQPQAGRSKRQLPRENHLDPELSPEAQIRREKALGRVKKYIEDGEIELDDDAHALLELIVNEGVNADPGTVLDKKWAIRTALRRMHDPRVDPKIQQKCFEVVLDLMGHIDSSKSKAGIVAQVAVDAVRRPNEE